MFIFANKSCTMNRLINYIWKYKLIPQKDLLTTSGDSIDIINVGIQDIAKENIFHKASIKIAGRLWSGNVILHTKSSEWESEIHNNGSHIYDNIILHVTQNNDIETLRKHGENIPQLQFNCPPEIAEEFTNCFISDKSLNCSSAIPTISTINMHSYMSRLLIERIEEKAEYIKRLYICCNCNWEQTLFKLMIRNHGFGIQSNTFEKLAETLNMQALAKHRDNITQVEAIFFGQAGLLNEDTIPAYYIKEAKESEYYNRLIREYKFLKNKFQLREIDGKIWESRSSAPHLRIARLAAIYSKEKVSISNITSCETLQELRNLLQIKPEGYWYNHTQFGSTETYGTPNIKNSQLDLLIINTIVPILYTYGKHRCDTRLCSKAEEYLHNIHSEDNKIVRKWAEKGIRVDCAADSQAVIQLQKSYCDKHKCAECHIAYAYIKDRMINKNGQTPVIQSL